MCKVKCYYSKSHWKHIILNVFIYLFLYYYFFNQFIACKYVNDTNLNKSNTNINVLIILFINQNMVRLVYYFFKYKGYNI